MLNVSNEFIKAMGSHPYIARITLDGLDVIQGQAVQEIFFRGGANSREDTILLGSAFSASVEIALDQNEISCAIEGRELFLELGIELEAGTEWIPMGKYTAQDPSETDGVLSVIAIDALGSKFDAIYEPVEGFDFTSADGVASTDFLAALCERRGVATDLSGLAPIALKGAPDGFTERQIIGFISALYGCFANIDRLGALRIRRYTAVDAAVSPDNYYEDGLQKATYSFNPGWLKCHNEAVGLTMFVGDMDAGQGINLESIWMNQAILNGLWEQLKDFSYRPVPELSFLGNPLIDPGDILSLEDAAGELVAVPVMTISHEYDGGIKTSISAYGQAKTTDYQGPTRRAVFRSAESAKQHVDKENAKLNQEELLKRLTNDWADDGIYLTEDGRLAVKASAIGVGVIASADGSIQFDLGNGHLSTHGKSLNLEETHELRITNEGLYIYIRDTNGSLVGALGLSVVDGLVNGEPWRSIQMLASHGTHLIIGGYTLSLGNSSHETKIYGSPITVSGAMHTGAINPGKTRLFTGDVAMGNSCTVPKTEYYDLFAVKLGDSSATYNTVVLAYKTGIYVRGVGGWAGTATESKQLYFFSAKIDGDTWTVEDAGVHNVYIGGGVEEGTRLHLKSITGII